MWSYLCLRTPADFFLSLSVFFVFAEIAVSIMKKKSRLPELRTTFSVTVTELYLDVELID